MRILILGGDGYLGWPTAMHFAAAGHDVMVIDNYLRRLIARSTQSEALFEAPNLEDRAEAFQAAGGSKIEVAIGDCASSIRYLPNSCPTPSFTMPSNLRPLIR
jgi:UDP-sulfoquinovose synthase